MAKQCISIIKNIALLLFMIVCIKVQHPVGAQTLTPPQLSSNLLQNPGFENGASEWKIPANAAQLVSDVAHDGSQSLHYANSDPAVYKTFSQNVEARPGQRLRFSIWAKGDNVTGSGAGVYVESYAGTQFLKGMYHKGAAGTFDWQRLESEFTVPANATKVTFGFFLRKNSTGSVWFDDACVQIIKPLPLVSTLTFPNYRGTLAQGDKTPWEYQLQIAREEDWPDKPLQIKTTLTDAAGKALLQKQQTTATQNQHVTLSLTPPANLALGEYHLAQDIIAPNGDKYRVIDQAIRIVQKMPKVFIDNAGFTVVDGKRFFPMGVYLHTPQTTDDHLQRIAEGGFNTILTYGYGNAGNPQDYLNRAASHHLKVIYAVQNMYPGRGNQGEEVYQTAASYMKNLHQSPALLAWYINDELSHEWISKIRKMYHQVVELDGDHPAFQVQDKVELLPDHFDNTDILATDPYPVGDPNLSKTTKSTRAATIAARSAKGVWTVAQLMDWHVYRPERESHPPSPDEMRNQAYQAIINGATGLLWYAYYDLMYAKSKPRNKTTEDMESFRRRWPDVTRMTQEINAIVPVVLNNQKVPLALPANASIQAAAWQDGDRLCVMLANPYYETKQLTLPLPEGWEIEKTIQGDIKSTFTDGQVTFELPSVASGVFYLEMR